MTVERSRTLTVLLAIPEEQRFHELVDGEIIRKADPSGEHGGSQAGDSVRAEPFDAIEIEVGTLFGDDPSH